YRGVKRPRPLKRSRRILDPPALGERAAKAVMDGGDVGLKRNHTAKACRRLIMGATALRQHAEQVQAADVLGFMLKNGAAHRLGLDPLAELMMPQCLRERRSGGAGRAAASPAALRGAPFLAIHRPDVPRRRGGEDGIRTHDTGLAV